MISVRQIELSRKKMLWGRLEMWRLGGWLTQTWLLIGLVHVFGSQRGPALLGFGRKRSLRTGVRPQECAALQGAFGFGSSFLSGFRWSLEVLAG
ncbi:hypothetical protein BV22DRAFT_572286 [Leucogyrophana mollusca]|uniref:Uncharacterized protein n=1 Tax=Leucogyrophana mollusca TaxID=85980 RepID=A0ACB8BCR2_9AGAM|nr:hypothetical protein BV22DRAFT_572286 [Leucogyrophana mollusca]